LYASFSTTKEMANSSKVSKSVALNPVQVIKRVYKPSQIILGYKISYFLFLHCFLFID
jgi:hypothetical protein